MVGKGQMEAAGVTATKKNSELKTVLHSWSICRNYCPHKRLERWGGGGSTAAPFNCAS